MDWWAPTIGLRTGVGFARVVFAAMWALVGWRNHVRFVSRVDGQEAGSVRRCGGLGRWFTMRSAAADALAEIQF